MAKREQSPYAPGTTSQQKLNQYSVVLQQLLAMTEHADTPLHPVSREVMRYVLAVFQICWNQPTTESRDAIVDRMEKMAHTMLYQTAYFRCTDPESARYARDLAKCVHLTIMNEESMSPHNVAAYEAWWNDKQSAGK